MRIEFVCAISCMLFLTCVGPVRRWDVLNTYLKEHMGNGSHGVRVVFHLSERGCLPCNKGLMELMEVHRSDPAVVLVISAPGDLLDLGGFLQDSSRVIWDTHGAFNDLGFGQGSGVVLLNDQRIDTAFTIQAREMQTQLDLIGSYLLEPQ